MKILILADIHSNLAALEKVLRAEPNSDETWCIGDIVGYGAQPNECIALLRSQPTLTCIAGNHDLGAIGKVERSLFNEDAQAACEWTENQLNADSRVFLESLEPTGITPGAVLAHGSPRNPVDEYILNMSIAQANFDYFATPLCLVAHSHIPIVFTRTSSDTGYMEETIVPQPNQPVTLSGLKAIINPGSVGQPRDGEPRASYMVLDLKSDRIMLKRTAYDIKRTQQAIIDAGLPERLATRLAYGW